MTLFFFVLAALAYTVQGVPVDDNVRSIITQEKSTVAKAVADIYDDNHRLPASLVNEIRNFEKEIDKNLLMPLESIKFFVDTDFDALQDLNECFDEMIVQLLPENLDVYTIPKSSSLKPTQASGSDGPVTFPPTIPAKTSEKPAKSNS